MPADRTTRTVIAALLIVAALLIAMNYVVAAQPLLDWWLPLVLFVVGVLFAAAPRARADADTTPGLGGAQIYTVREYTFEAPATAPSLAAAGREQAGEVNVREPLDEAESAGTRSKTTDLPVDTDEPVPAAPETVTGPGATPSPAEEEEVIEAPETMTPPEEQPDEDASDRIAADMDAAGEFAPPATIEGAVNPPTESDSAPGVVVAPGATEEPAVPGDLPPNQYRDVARKEMPLEPMEPQTEPEVTEKERLEQGEKLLQPQDTAENEFQSGEHVAANLPTDSAPVGTQTTGEDRGAGHDPIPPEESVVLEKQAAPRLPDELSQVEPTSPEIAEHIANHEQTEAEAEALADSDSIRPESASSAASGSEGPDDLAVIIGLGPVRVAALKAAGIDTFAKLAAATDDDLRAAMEAAGQTFTPTLTTWREQAIFLVRGDRAGFEAIRNKLAEERRSNRRK